MTLPAIDFRLDSIRDDERAFGGRFVGRLEGAGRHETDFNAAQAANAIDAALLARIRASDASAMTELFDRHLNPLLRFAESMLVAGAQIDDASDVVGDVLSTLWERRAKLADVQNVRAYLYRAVYHRAIDRRRAARRARVQQSAFASVGETPGMAPAAPAADETMERAELRALVWHTVHTMREPLRTVAILRWSHGMGFAEIGESIDCSEGAARVHAGRALALLRTALPRLLR